jgi:hypothetical protein
MGRAGSQQQSVSIGRRACDVFGADRAGCPAFVLDDDRLPQALACDLRHHAGTDIRAATGRERHHQFDLTRGILLFLCRDRRTGGEQGGDGNGYA